MRSTFNLEDVERIENPSKRFPMKEHYHNTLVDLVFKDGTVLSIAGSEKLPYSVEFVTKVRIHIFLNLRLLRLLAFFPSIANN